MLIRFEFRIFSQPKANKMRKQCQCDKSALAWNANTNRQILFLCASNDNDFAFSIKSDSPNRNGNGQWKAVGRAGLFGVWVIWYNQIKINKNSHDCKLVAENGR